jgi:hypothetical protein
MHDEVDKKVAENAADRLKRELHRTIDHLRGDLNRVEILTAALSAFSRPVPDYEPAFRHLHRTPLSAFEIGPDAAKD